MSSSRSTSRDYSSKRNPLVRSLRAKSSSSTGSSSLHRKKTEAGAQPGVLLEADQLNDESEAKEGLTPITLTRWILSQGQSYGSVYLLPFVRQGEEDQQGGQGPSGYRYTIVGTNQPSGQKHFYTLR